MIAAQRSSWFTWLFARHARSRLQATFGRILVHGVDEARQASATTPLVAVVNHTTWWDPLVVLWLSDLVLGAEGYAMMDARNLRRLPFFARVGAFGVDLDDEVDGARAVRHAAKLLDGPGRVVWIFPEGEERSPFAPLALRPGAAAVARVARSARVLPVALRYVFGGDERPDLLVSVGAAEEAPRDVAAGVAAQGRAIAGELARIDGALATRDVSAFACVHDRRPKGEPLAARLLARMLPLR